MIFLAPSAARLSGPLPSPRSVKNEMNMYRPRRAVMIATALCPTTAFAANGQDGV
jgi:hypothetical protein